VRLQRDFIEIMGLQDTGTEINRNTILDIRIQIHVWTVILDKIERQRYFYSGMAASHPEILFLMLSHCSYRLAGVWQYVKFSEKKIMITCYHDNMITLSW
jgi:hypothetical protein